jgi:hypothetical protein
VGVLAIREHIGDMSDSAVQYCAPSRNRSVGPLGIYLGNLIEDVGCEIMARRVVKQFTVIPPDNTKYRITQTHSTFDDCVENWLNVRRRSTDEVEHLARRSLML